MRGKKHYKWNINALIVKTDAESTLDLYYYQGINLMCSYPALHFSKFSLH